MLRKLLIPLIFSIVYLTGCLPEPGSKIVINEQCPGTVSPADFKEMWSKSSDADLAGLQEMQRAGKVVFIPALTKGVLVEKEQNLAKIEVEIHGQVHRLWVSGENISKE